MAGGFWRALRSSFAASLRVRVLVLTLAAFVAVAIPAAVSFVWIVDKTIVRLGTLFAERQILYDRFRGLEALTRELALAETLTRSPIIVEWAQDELDRDRYARGIAELEHFRRTFADGSYFFVIQKSLNYYYNDNDGSYTGAQQRYTLSQDNPRDGWYFETLAAGPGCHLNVDHDDVLQVTKVWMNCVVTFEGEVMGIVGTGLDLTAFLREVVETEQPGVETMLINRSGAVQANRDATLIDFHSITKPEADRKTFFHQIDDEADRIAFAGMMGDVAAGKSGAASRFMSIDGTRMLVGVGYLDDLDWYNVTVMDVGVIIDRALFKPIAALILLTMAAAVALVVWLFKRSVLDRLQRAEASVRAIEQGDFAQPVRDAGTDEIGRLARALDAMARAVGTDRASLEAAVRERTEQLERIAYIDQLSGVLNRRGFVEAYAQEERRIANGHSRPGLLILDIDSFKAINDAHGHAAGDEVIAEVARRLIDVTREQDLCARWGGDEFVVILKAGDPRAVAVVGDKILDAVRSRPVELANGALIRVATSIGAHIVGPADTLESAASKADLALYAAKRQGRNRMVVYDPRLHGETMGVGRVA
jgi:diguanylate cyclase (GGDEF)-like protein